MTELGLTQDASGMYWHEMRMFNIIDSEWKSLEVSEMKRQSRKKR